MANAVIATGNASIVINPLETEARLVFIPDSEGDGWDAAAVNKLASDNRLGACPDPKALESFLQKAGKAKTSEPMEMVFCQGIAPEDAQNEKVVWEALPIPDDVALYREEALANAKAPVVFRVKTERIKHEKKVKKPSPLPFMPPKEEIVVSWEKKESREEVIVNPEPLEVKYADKGAKLGTVTPASPGKPGKSVFGRPVPPPAPGEEACLPGEGIDRNKNDLYALVSGFLRIGENWADMVSLSRPSWTVKTGVDGLTPFFNFEPGDSRFTLPTGEEILAAAAAQGAGAESMVGADELDRMIAAAVENHEPVEAFALLRAQEAEARVKINPEKTRAALFLRKGVAGSLPLEMKAISLAIKNSGVKGFDTEALKNTINSFMTGKDLVLSDYALVEGTPSTRGKDREVEIRAALLSPDERKTVLARLTGWRNRGGAADGEIDPARATGFAFVEKGETVAAVSDASEGEPGKDIYGAVIPGLPGNDPELKLFRALELHGSAVIASESGLLVIEASERSFLGEVVAYSNAKVEVQISGDAMEARADLYREEGAGVPLTAGNVLKVLGAQGIVKGIIEEEVEKACALARERGSAKNHVLARGILPLAKGGSAIKWLLPVNPPELAEASAEASGEAEASAETEVSVEIDAPAEAETSADAPQNITIQVKAGAPILEMSEPAAEGRPGYSVTGTEIPMDKASDLVIEHDSSIRETPLGKGKRFVAARSGELSFDGKELKISSVRIIEGDAGPATGNISFSGEIKISGNVLPGCVVMGASHVTVDGVAEGAFISAGGKAVVALGFKGGGKGVIRARAGIETDFAERASVMAVGDINLKRGSILSNIKTNGKLSISADNGKFSGGICQARYGMETGDLGSEKGIRTEVSFGQDYLVKDQIAACEEDIVKLRRALSEVEAKIKNALQGRLSIPEDVRKEKVRQVKLLEQLNLKVFTLKEKFEEHYESEVRVRGAVFPGVIIESHDRYYEVKQKRNDVVFCFDSKTGRITENPGN